MLQGVCALYPLLEDVMDGGFLQSKEFATIKYLLWIVTAVYDFVMWFYAKYQFNSNGWEKV